MANAFDDIVVSDETRIYIDMSVDISVRIHRLLKEKKISQKELASRLGKKESEISKWLTGFHNFTLKSIAKIEAILGEKIVSIPKKKKTVKKKADAMVFFVSSETENFNVPALWGNESQKASRIDQMARLKEDDSLIVL